MNYGSFLSYSGLSRHPDNEPKHALLQGFKVRKGSFGLNFNSKILTVRKFFHPPLPKVLHKRQYLVSFQVKYNKVLLLY